MAIASVEDVKRVLKSEEANNIVVVQAALGAAEDYVRRVTGRNWATDTTQTTATFNNVRDDSMLEMPEEDASIDEVKIFVTAGSSGDVLVENDGYQVIRGGRKVQLLPRHEIPILREAATRNLGGGFRSGRSTPIDYERVEVKYTPSGNVPAAVREATALMAAALVARQGDQVKGLSSETLGDYSYSIGQGGATLGSDAVPAQARALLRPFRRSRVVAI